MSINLKIIKELSKTTKLVLIKDKKGILKEIEPFDIPLYKKLIEIEHKNLAKIYNLFEADGKTYILQEYVEGYSIEEQINNGKVFSEDEIKFIVGEMCLGLNELHSNGVVHRDITPSNIILGQDVKIIDFGISRQIKSNKSRDTQILGTQGFAAPEQFGFSQTSPAADIYALGVLINYMSTGKLPNEEFARNKYSRIVNKCLQMDPLKRYENTLQIKNDLEGKGFKNIFTKIIGFRTGHIYKEALACIYYFFALLTTLVTCYDFKENRLANDLFETLWLFAWLFYGSLVPIFDYGNWTKKLLPNSSKSERIFARIVGLIIVFIISLLPIIILSLKEM